MGRSSSPIRGNFIPVSTSLGSRSPRRPKDLGLHIHLSLTDSQMDRLTSAIPGQRSPEKGKQRHLGGPWMMDPSKSQDLRKGYTNGANHHHLQSSPGDRETTRLENSGKTTSDMIAAYSPGEYTTPRHRMLRSRSRSPTKRSQSPSKTPHSVPHSSTGQSPVISPRNILPPTPVDAEKAREYKSNSARKHQDFPATFTPSPRHSPVRPAFSVTDDSSSLYSQDGMDESNMPPVSPLRISKGQESITNISALRSYNEWARSTASPDRFLARDVNQTQAHAHRGIPRTNTTGDLRNEGDKLQRTWSPLSDYLTSHDMPIRKELVGARGWLERTTDSSSKKPSPDKKVSQTKKVGLLDSLKKIAKDIKVPRMLRDSEKENHSARLSVSLEPREQSLLYCELEFILTTALEGYISSQFNAGRLDADKYKKIVDGWQQKGRPKVVGFRYDLETQLELVHLHSTDFRFYGRRAGLTVAVNGLLEMMKVNARVMRIRTFCQPDTVVAKQLLDSQSLFNLLGSSEPQQIRLAEIIQFYKIILQRERLFHSHREATETSTLQRDADHWDENEEVAEGQGGKSHSDKYQSSGGDQNQSYGI